jgi:hypothetical protein
MRYGRRDPHDDPPRRRPRTGASARVLTLAEMQHTPSGWVRLRAFEKEGKTLSNVIAHTEVGRFVTDGSFEENPKNLALRPPKLSGRSAEHVTEMTR